MKTVGDLELMIFRPPVAPQDRARFEAAYRLWRTVWTEANRLMSNPHPDAYPSDNFTRQSEILCLFRGEKPVALIFHRHLDFDSETTYDDSTFYPGTWLEEDKQAVRTIGGVGFMGSQITVCPTERGVQSGVSLKNLIVLLSLAHAQNLGVETVVAAIRTAKGLERIFGGAGCLTLASGRPFYDLTIELIAFRPQLSPIHIEPDYKELVESLLRSARRSKPLAFNSQPRHPPIQLPNQNPNLHPHKRKVA